MDQNTINRMIKGDMKAVEEIRCAIVGRKLSKEDAVRVFSAAIVAMTNQSGDSVQGLMNKRSLFAITYLISDSFHNHRLTEAESDGLIAGTDYRQICEKISNEPSDRLIGLVDRLEEVVALGMLCTDEAIAIYPDKKYTPVLEKLKKDDTDGVIKTAAMAMEYGASPFVQQAAKAALVNAGLYGSGNARKYAAEALIRLFNTKDMRKDIAGMATGSESASMRKAASKLIEEIRRLDELDTLNEDREFLLGQEYPEGNDETIAQREFVKQMLDAAETVMETIGSKTNGKQAPESDDAIREDYEIEICLFQLSRIGAAPGVTGRLLEKVIGRTIDETNLKIVARNVENALLHAFLYGDETQRNLASAGLYAMASKREIFVLNRISVRERTEDGVLNETGRAARELVLKIERKVYGRSLPPPMPPKAQQRAQNPKLRTN